NMPRECCFSRQRRSGRWVTSTETSPFSSTSPVRAARAAPPPVAIRIAERHRRDRRQFRLLTGTTDAMPGIGLGPNGWVTTHRSRPDLRHISTEQLIPTPVDTVWIDVRLEHWRGAPYHECDVFVLTGDPPTETKHEPEFYSDEPDPYDPLVI